MNNKEQSYELIKFKDGDFSLDVKVSPKEDTVWLTQDEMASLFDVDRTRIVRHINNIYNECELDKMSTCAETAHMGVLGVQTYKTKLYNLDMIISVGYRVKSKRGIIFRKWTTNGLKKYLLKGYALNENRVISNEKYIELRSEVVSINDRLLKNG